VGRWICFPCQKTRKLCSSDLENSEFYYFTLSYFRKALNFEAAALILLLIHLGYFLLNLAMLALIECFGDLPGLLN
jgi:hypothetical protein